LSAGVKATDPDTEVNVTYTGSFGDTALAAEAANTHIKAGADVLTGSAQQVVGAIGVAAENAGVYWFGSQSNQTSLAPNIVVMNQVYDWTGSDQGHDRLAQQRHAGRQGLHHDAQRRRPDDRLQRPGSTVPPRSGRRPAAQTPPSPASRMAASSQRSKLSANLLSGG
jgi:hypothetical protein